VKDFILQALLAIVIVMWVCVFAPIVFGSVEAPPAYCDGMARPADKAECPPANPPKAQSGASNPQVGVPNARFVLTGGEICWAEGGDCVEFMLQDRDAYCVWASDLAAVGAWFRRDKDLTLPQTLARLQPKLKRPLTANEVKHIHYWLTWGWIAGGVKHEYDVRKDAEAACNRIDGAAEPGPSSEAANPAGYGVEG